MIVTIIIFILTILTLVVIHEFGHFIMAKKFGIKVLEFGFGIPPRIWGKKIGETLVSINWLPFGGFVRLLGEDEVDERSSTAYKKLLEDKRSFAHQPVWQRIIVVVAGVTMNLLLAWLLFYIVVIASGFKETLPLIKQHQFVGVEQTQVNTVVIGRVADGSPAKTSGIEPGDRVKQINGQAVDDAQQLIDQTKATPGKVIKLTLIDPSEAERVVEVTPRVNPPEGQGALGVELGTIKMAQLEYVTPLQKIFSGISHSYNLTTYSLSIMSDLVGASVKSGDIKPVSQGVSGPVGITNLTNSILQTESPLIPYLNFVGILSLNLALFNILPIPALDGGRLFFLLIEAFFRRKVKAEVERWIHTVGMVFLIGLIILITFSDIKKFF